MLTPKPCNPPCLHNQCIPQAQWRARCPGACVRAPMCGCRTPLLVPEPPSVTWCSMDTLSPTIAVSPITTPVAWSMNTPRPTRAAGWMSTCSTSDTRLCSAVASVCAHRRARGQRPAPQAAGCEAPHALATVPRLATPDTVFCSVCASLHEARAAIQYLHLVQNVNLLRSAAQQAPSGWTARGWVARGRTRRLRVHSQCAMRWHWMAWKPLKYRMHCV